MLSRFVYGDLVWNKFTGNYIDLNGLLMALAMELCNLLKQPAMTKKAEREEDNRKTKASDLTAQPDRDGVDRTAKDKESSRKDDEMHAIFGESFIDILCSIILQMLQAMQGLGVGDDSNSSRNRGGAGANVNTEILDNEAWCITDAILDNIESLTDEALDDARSQSNSSSSSSDSSYISSILALLMAGMRFVLTQKYAEQTEIFNAAGARSQDKKTKDQGCNDVRQYNGDW